MWDKDYITVQMRPKGDWSIERCAKYVVELHMS